VTKKKLSKASRPKWKKGAAQGKRSAFGRALVAGAKEMLAYVRGEIELPSYTLAGPQE